MDKDLCWICREQANSVGGDGKILCYDCKRCGKYAVDLSIIDKRIRENSEIANASGWVREHQGITINQSVFQKIISLKAPSANERADKLLKWLCSETKHLGQSIKIDISDKTLYSVCWTINEKEIKYLVCYLFDKSFISNNNANSGNPNAIPFNITVSVNGFSYLDEIDRKTQSNIGFCVMPFVDRLTPVWHDAISPAIVDAGYEPKRIDEHPHSTGIVDQILSMIRRSKFIIADLTGQNKNVYFEAGFAYGLNRDVFFICEKESFEDKHFDIQHIVIEKYSINNLSELRSKLKWRIEGAIGHGQGLIRDE